MKAFLLLLGASIGILITIAIFAFFYFEEGKSHPFFIEGGWIEQVTVLLFCTSSLIAGFVFLKTKFYNSFLLSAFMAMAAMRELDWHKTWTSDSILKSRFYLSDATPITEKIIGAAVIIFLAYLVVKLLMRTKNWLYGLKNGSLSALTLFFALGSLVSAKFLDSFSRLLPSLAEFKSKNTVVFTGIEETTEMISAGFFVMLAVLLWRNYKT